MKYFIISNILLGINSLDSLNEKIEDYFDNYFIPLLKREYKKDDKIIILGNLFYTKNVSDNTLLLCLNILNKLLEYDIIILKGEKDGNILDYIAKFDNVELIKKPHGKCIRLYNKNMLFLPYSNKKDCINVLNNYSTKTDMIISAYPELSEYFNKPHIINDFQMLMYNKKSLYPAIKILNFENMSITTIDNIYSSKYIDKIITDISGLTINDKDYYSISFNESLLDDENFKAEFNKLKFNSKITFNITKNNSIVKELNTCSSNITDIIYSIIDEKNLDEDMKSDIKKLINDNIEIYEKKLRN